MIAQRPAVVLLMAAVAWSVVFVLGVTPALAQPELEFSLGGSSVAYIGGSNPLQSPAPGRSKIMVPNIIGIHTPKNDGVPYNKCSLLVGQTCTLTFASGAFDHSTPDAWVFQRGGILDMASVALGDSILRSPVAPPAIPPGADFEFVQLITDNRCTACPAPFAFRPGWRLSTYVEIRDSLGADDFISVVASPTLGSTLPGPITLNFGGMVGRNVFAFSQLSSTMADSTMKGTYEIEATTKASGKLRITTHLLDHPQELPFAKNVKVSDSSTAPIVRWTEPTVDIPFGYRRLDALSVSDSSGNEIFFSGRKFFGDGEAVFQVPAGRLSVGQSYLFDARFFMVDTLDRVEGPLDNLENRSRFRFVFTPEVQIPEVHEPCTAGPCFTSDVVVTTTAGFGTLDGTFISRLHPDLLDFYGLADVVYTHRFVNVTLSLVGTPSPGEPFTSSRVSGSTESTPISVPEPSSALLFISSLVPTIAAPLLRRRRRQSVVP